MLPNDQAQQPGPLARLHASKNRNAAPVCCSGWFGATTPHHGATAVTPATPGPYARGGGVASGGSWRTPPPSPPAGCGAPRPLGPEEAYGGTQRTRRPAARTPPRSRTRTPRTPTGRTRTAPTASCGRPTSGQARCPALGTARHRGRRPDGFAAWGTPAARSTDAEGVARACCPANGCASRCEAGAIRCSDGNSLPSP